MIKVTLEWPHTFSLLDAYLFFFFVLFVISYHDVKLEAPRKTWYCERFYFPNLIWFRSNGCEKGGCGKKGTPQSWRGIVGHFETFERMAREALKHRKWSIKRRIFTEDNPSGGAGRVEFTLEPSFYNSSRFTYSIINYAFLVLASFNSLSVFYLLLK